jgi:hypothetical protein
MLDLSSKKTDTLLPTDILFQTPYWAKVKSSQGLDSLAFDIVSAGPRGDVLVLLKPCGKRKIAVIPQGPEHAPCEEDYGIFLEDFSLTLAKNLSTEVAFIRYDLPWKSQYSDEMQKLGWSAFPEPRLRELRMNMGTRFWNIRKSFEDMTVASSLVVDIVGSENEILERMKPKTRYNIGLAQRKGVTIHEVNTDCLLDFYTLYCQTAIRNGLNPADTVISRPCFSALHRHPVIRSCYSCLLSTDGKSWPGPSSAFPVRPQISSMALHRTQNVISWLHASCTGPPCFTPVNEVASAMRWAPFLQASMTPARFTDYTALKPVSAEGLSCEVALGTTLLTMKRTALFATQKASTEKLIHQKQERNHEAANNKAFILEERP